MRGVETRGVETRGVETRGVEMRKGRSMTGPSQVPRQGDNPNIALTRPQIISPLTLVG